MKKKLLISFSGGRTSAYMTWWLMNKWPDRTNWDMIVVFANTGKEDEKTLNFVNACDKTWTLNVVWVEALVKHEHRKGTKHTEVDFLTASRSGEPFEQVISKYGIPNQAFPHCTRELKTAPIHSFVKSLGWVGYYTAIGIRVDEFDRMNPDRKKLKYIYPLVENNISLRDVSVFWSNQSFDLGIASYQGNCDLCWKKSSPKIEKILKESPEKMKWWKDMEDKYGTFIPKSRSAEPEALPIRFYRKSKSIIDFINNKQKWEQQDLFEFGCSESCEAF